MNWNGKLPIDTWAHLPLQTVGPLYGLLAWGLLIVFACNELRGPRHPGAWPR